MSDVFAHLDEVVQRLAGLRDELLADECAPDRAARLAAVFDAEAEAWSQLFELASLRLVWRAALAAEAGARANAARWSRRAARRARRRPTSWAAGRVGAPRPVALTTSVRSPRWWSVMDSVGALILFAVLGSVICAKARVAGGAVVFALIGLVLFVSTPAGRALPEAMSGLVSTVDGAATPALTGHQPRAPERGAGRMSAASARRGRVCPQGRAGRATAGGAACGGRAGRPSA